jgi:hypothetical protein
MHLEFLELSMLVQTDTETRRWTGDEAVRGPQSGLALTPVCPWAFKDWRTEGVSLVVM